MHYASKRSGRQCRRLLDYWNVDVETSYTQSFACGVRCLATCCPMTQLTVTKLTARGLYKSNSDVATRRAISRHSGQRTRKTKEKILTQQEDGRRCKGKILFLRLLQ